jgi:hypothetical protein
MQQSSMDNRQLSAKVLVCGKLCADDCDPLAVAGPLPVLTTDA